MTRDRLIARLESLRRKADNAAWWLILHDMDHPQFNDVAAAHKGLRAQMIAVQGELAEMADSPLMASRDGA